MIEMSFSDIIMRRLQEIWEVKEKDGEDITVRILLVNDQFFSAKLSEITDCTILQGGIIFFMKDKEHYFNLNNVCCFSLFGKAEEKE